MEETRQEVEQRKGSPPRGRPRPVEGRKLKRQKYQKPLPYETKLKAVKLYLEEGMSAELVGAEVGVWHGTIHDWVRQYREHGEDGLRPKSRTHRSVNLPTSVKDKIVAMKREHPSHGVRRIAQLLRRMFMLPGSHETVRQTLHEHGLISPPKKKSQRNPSKPRFFERATPNQMWQSDIFTFHLGGKQAYLIGFMDDYSRYLVACGLFRSQTAENVLEAYRRAAGEYGVPKEMLTDNGRQYTNWRGKTRFEVEMQKDRVHHFRSTPHHPMTLGKIERFWKTIWEEFLVRAQFDSFESAQERVRCWVKYYNHKRPHQGIGGLCPADRFFEIQNGLRQAIEKGIEENALELALRGKPRSPFYMVGRMGGQSVVIRAEKGKLRMLVDGQDDNKELVYDVTGEKNHDEQGGREAGSAGVQCAGEMPGRLERVDGETQGRGDLPGVGDQLGGAELLAEPGAGRDAGGAGPEAEQGSEGGGAGTPAEGTAGKETGATGGQTVETGAAPDEDPGLEGASSEILRQAYLSALRAAASEDAATRVSPAAERTVNEAHPSVESGYAGMDRGSDPGTQRADESRGSGTPAGHLPQDVLQAGKEGAGSDDGRPCRPVFRAARCGGGRGEGAVEGESGGLGAGEDAASESAPDQGSAERATG